MAAGPRGRVRRGGFTLIEIVIALVVILTLLAILVPQLAGRGRDAEAAALLEGLTTAADAASSFKADVRRFPGQLTFLTDTATTTPVDLCGNTIPPVLRQRWGGPYLQQVVTSAGIRAGTTTIQNELVRSPAAGEVSNMVLVATDVDQRTAQWIDDRADDGDLGTGGVGWIDGGNGQGAILYSVPIRGC